MPYIIQEKRDRLNGIIKELHTELVNLESDDEHNNFEGNMNYIIMKLIAMCYDDSYRSINDVVGMLECVKQEYYRKTAAPYENQAEYRNGPVTDEIFTPIFKDGND